MADSEIFRASPKAMALLDTSGVVRDANAAMQRLAGYALGELTGRAASELLEKLVLIPGDGEGVLANAHGAKLVVHQFLTPLSDGWLLTLDPCETEGERRFRAIFDNTFEFIGLLDLDGRVLEVNHTALDFIGCTIDEVRDHLFAETPWWDHSPEYQAILRDAIQRAARGETVRFECTHPGTDGNLISIDFSIQPVRSAAGEIVFLVPEGRDITDRVRAELALQEAKAEAEAASQAKSQFLATISHELRTPLNAVIGFSETILGEVFGPLGNTRYGEYVRLIHSAGSHLRDLIEDILDVARIEMGATPLHEEQVALGPLLRETVILMGPKAQDHRVRLDVHTPRALPQIMADPLRLRQVVLNLLSNAIKFTPAGGRVDLAASAAGDGLEIRVTDTGIGIAPGDLAHVWRPFFQADASLSRRFGGTGLGLPIVRHYVHAHGGTVTIESQPGKGTAFIVRLPAERLLPARAAQRQA